MTRYVNKIASILWEFGVNTEEFEFKSIQDVLDELEEMKAENKYLKGVLETNITEILRKQEEQEQDLTDLRINLGKTSDQVESLDLLTQEQGQAIVYNSNSINDNSDDINSVNLKWVWFLIFDVCCGLCLIISKLIRPLFMQKK